MEKHERTPCLCLFLFDRYPQLLDVVELCVDALIAVAKSGALDWRNQTFSGRTETLERPPRTRRAR